MFSRTFRRSVLAGLCLLVLCLIGVWVFTPTSGTSTAKKLTAPVTTPAIAANAATASIRASAVKSATGKGTASHKATPTGKVNVTATPKTAPRAVAAASTGSTVYGISDPDLINESAAVQVQQLKAMKALGLTSVRLEANWYWGQPSESGSYTWAPLDQEVASIQEAGLSADLVIDGCPPWAAVSGTQNTQYAQPSSATEFAAWAGAVAARYGAKGVPYFEIWNEPNLATFWQPKPDPAAYTADLKAAYAAIKAVDPSSVVLSGGLGQPVAENTDYEPVTFLQDMYSDGAQGSFDGVGYHPYSYPDSPDTVASWSGWSMMSDTSPSVRSVMEANGDSGKKIWITEYGAPTSGPSSVGESGQTTELAQAISQARGTGWIASLYIYTWSDISSLPADQEGFGLLTDSGTQKPAYTAVSAALTGSG